MSNAVLPVLAGLGWPVVKTPMFSTKVQRAVSGKEYRTAYYQYPLYTFSILFDLLRDVAAYLEQQELLGFFLARQGSFDNFLYTDPNDCVVTAQVFETGDGVNALFPLVRT